MAFRKRNSLRSRVRSLNKRLLKSFSVFLSLMKVRISEALSSDGTDASKNRFV